MESTKARSGDRRALFAEITEGVRDVAVPQDTNSWEHSVQTGIHSSIGPFVPSELGETLRYTFVAHEEVGGLREVDPRFVLGEPWSADRLAGARRRLADGVADDPIWVEGVDVPGLPLL
jgi:hypothetical protein